MGTVHSSSSGSASSGSAPSVTSLSSSSTSMSTSLSSCTSTAPAVPSLAMVAVGQQMDLRQDQLLALRAEIKKISSSSSSSSLSQQQHHPLSPLTTSSAVPPVVTPSSTRKTMMIISREDLMHAVEQAHITNPKTVTLIDLLFTMWDQDGLNCIPGRDFIVGMVPLVSSMTATTIPLAKTTTASTDRRNNVPPSPMRRNHRGHLVPEVEQPLQQNSFQPKTTARSTMDSNGSISTTKNSNVMSLESILRFAISIVTMDKDFTIMEQEHLRSINNNNNTDMAMIDQQELMERKRWIGWNDLNILLTAINSMASYFGDPELTPCEIQRVVSTVLSKSGEVLEMVDHEECVRKLMASQYIRRFAKGKPRLEVRFQDDDLVDVVSYLVPTPIAQQDRELETEMMKLGRESKINEMRKAAAAASLMDASSCSFDSTADDDDDDDAENSGLSGNRSRDPPSLLDAKPKTSKFSMRRLPIPILSAVKIRRPSRDPPAAGDA